MTDFDKSEKILNDSSEQVNKNCRRILSWDVGIKNLAYCLMEIEDQKFKIIKWDIVNLADDRHKCCFSKKRKNANESSNLCTSIANHIFRHPTRTEYYCKQHISKVSCDPEPIKLNIEKFMPVDCSNSMDCCGLCDRLATNHLSILTQNLKFCDKHRFTILKKEHLICEHKSCKNPITMGIQSLNKMEIGWCDDHWETDHTEWIGKRVKKISQNCNKLPLDKLGCSMFSQLDMIPELLQVDEVLVENQPTHINPTMKTISCMLYSYFLMRGFYEKDKTNSSIRTMQFCAPSGKLKIGGSDAEALLEEAGNDSSKRVYNVTKSLGIKYCLALIDDYPEWIENIGSRKKKDDMCDALLQGFIMKFNPVPPYYVQKIQNMLGEKTEPIKTEKKKISPLKIKKTKKIADVEIKGDMIDNNADMVADNSDILAKIENPKKKKLKQKIKAVSNISAKIKKINDNPEIDIYFGTNF